MWSRLGIDLSRGTMCQWVMKCGDLLSPLVDLLKADILKSDYVHADETGVQVLSEPGRKASSKSYMWVFMTGACDNTSIVYQYDPTRQGQVAEEFLSGYKGYLQTDAYSGYNAVTKNKKVIQVGCMAHARRKFVEITSY